MDPYGSEQTRQLYRDLLHATRATARRIRARLRRLRERYPDLPPEAPAEPGTVGSAQVRTVDVGKNRSQA
jgi:hypothetical protein